MKDICIVTSYNRPEMLHECLRRIQIAQGNLELLVYVSLDNRIGAPYHPDIIEVLRRFNDKLDIKLKVRHPHSFPGNSHNTLEAYKEAFKAAPQYVFLIEDDVMISKDFFQFHYAAHQLTKLFCSVGVKCTRRSDIAEIDDPERIWVSGSDYASLGVCFPHDSLGYIIPHAHEPYYSNMPGYVARYFKDSRFKNEFAEQDGLILRIMGHWNGLCGWPYASTARAFHAGYYGYHRMDGAKPFGQLDERIENFREIMFDKDKLELLGPNYGDIHPCNLDGYEWAFLDIGEVYG